MRVDVPPDGVSIPLIDLNHFPISLILTHMTSDIPTMLKAVSVSSIPDNQRTINTNAKMIVVRPFKTEHKISNGCP